MDELRIILEEERTIPVLIGKDRYEVRKLSFMDLRDIACIFASVFTKLRGKLAEIKTDGKTNTEDMFELFKILDEVSLIQLLKIFLHTEDTNTCARLLKYPEAVLKIIKAVCELNDFGELLKNVQEMLKATKKETLPGEPLTSLPK